MAKDVKKTLAKQKQNEPNRNLNKFFFITLESLFNNYNAYFR